MSTILYRGGNVELEVPVGEKIAVSCLNGTCIIYYNTFPDSPETFFEQTRVTQSSTELGTFSGKQKIRLEALDADATYDVAVTPSVVTAESIDQIKNIGTTTISSTQWGYVGDMDQGVATTDEVDFEGLDVIKAQNATTALKVTNTDTTNSNSRGSVTVQGGNCKGDITAIHGLGLFIGSSSGDNMKFNPGGTTSLVMTASDGYVAIGRSVSSPATSLEVGENDTLTGNVTDSYTGAITFDAGYTVTDGGNHTVTRHNYINCEDLSETETSGTITITDACLVRYNAAAGTHKAVDSGTTKTTPGTVDAWEKRNVNGTVYYCPLYTSKTS